MATAIEKESSDASQRDEEEVRQAEHEQEERDEGEEEEERDSSAAPGDPGTMAGCVLEADLLAYILTFILSVGNIPCFSAVARTWSARTLEPNAWAGSHVDISDVMMCPSRWTRGRPRSGCVQSH